MHDHRQDLLKRIGDEIKTYEAMHSSGGQPVETVMRFDDSDGYFEYAWNGDRFMLTHSNTKAQRALAT